MLFIILMSFRGCEILNTAEFMSILIIFSHLRFSHLTTLFPSHYYTNNPLLYLNPRPSVSSPLNFVFHKWAIRMSGPPACRYGHHWGGGGVLGQSGQSLGPFTSRFSNLLLSQWRIAYRGRCYRLRSTAGQPIAIPPVWSLAVHLRVQT